MTVNQTLTAAEIPDWRANLPAGEYGQLLCPIPRCTGQLRILFHAAVPLHVDDTSDHQFSDAVTDSWEVECTEGHMIHDHVDQIRQHNANLPDDSDDLLDETGDQAPAYDHALLCARVLSILKPALLCAHEHPETFARKWDELMNELSDLRHRNP